MYNFKTELKNELFDNINITKLSEDIGIDRSYLSTIINGGRSCSKVIAYCITKKISINAEITDYFIKGE